MVDDYVVTGEGFTLRRGSRECIVCIFNLKLKVLQPKSVAVTWVPGGSNDAKAIPYIYIYIYILQDVACAATFPCGATSPWRESEAQP